MTSDYIERERGSLSEILFTTSSGKSNPGVF